VVFSKIFFVSDSNEIAVSYCLGLLEFRHSESSGHRPDLLVWEPKIWVFLSFFVFCEFLLNDKREVKFSRLKKAHWKEESSGEEFIVIVCLIRELWPFKCFFGVQIR
jgi:hypothetical protein